MEKKWYRWNFGVEKFAPLTYMPMTDQPTFSIKWECWGDFDGNQSQNLTHDFSN